MRWSAANARQRQVFIESSSVGGLRVGVRLDRRHLPAALLGARRRVRRRACTGRRDRRGLTTATHRATVRRPVDALNGLQRERHRRHRHASARGEIGSELARGAGKEVAQRACHDGRERRVADFPQMRFDLRRMLAGGPRRPDTRSTPALRPQIARRRPSDRGGRRCRSARRPCTRVARAPVPAPGPLRATARAAPRRAAAPGPPPVPCSRPTNGRSACCARVRFGGAPRQIGARKQRRVPSGSRIGCADVCRTTPSPRACAAARPRSGRLPARPVSAAAPTTYRGSSRLSRIHQSGRLITRTACTRSRCRHASRSPLEAELAGPPTSGAGEASRFRCRATRPWRSAAPVALDTSDPLARAIRQVAMRRGSATRQPACGAARGAAALQRPLRPRSPWRAARALRSHVRDRAGARPAAPAPRIVAHCASSPSAAPPTPGDEHHNQPPSAPAPAPARGGGSLCAAARGCSPGSTLRRPTAGNSSSSNTR